MPSGACGVQGETMKIGAIETVALRDVWSTEDGDFTPWLCANIGALDSVLGLGLAKPRPEVGAGDFSIDIVAETDVGDIVIENQYGRSDHRHLGQLVTYLSHRQVQRAIWILEAARPEHVKAVETLNQRGVGQIWMVTVRTVRIGDSPAAPLFTVVVQPSEIGGHDDPPQPEPTPTHVKRRDFMSALFEQARDERIDSPFKSPNIHGISHVRARGAGLVYRVVVNSRQSRVVLTNTTGKWQGALEALEGGRAEIDADFKTAGLPGTLEWPEGVQAGRWVIRYTVDAGYEDETGPTDKMRELNQASAALKHVFQPHINQLPAELEEASSSEDLSGIE